MNDYLILKLEGPMQSWGGHTLEDYRPTLPFPTKSGLAGLLAACLGITRFDRDKQDNLFKSFTYAVRRDEFPEPERTKTPTTITDFHTVLDARKVGGTVNTKNPIVSRREYICDAVFTAALLFKPDFDRKTLLKALANPCFTPYLGRKSCPLCRPLYQNTVQASGFLEALRQVPPAKGLVYSEQNEGSISELRVRDVPLSTHARQFDVRKVFIHQLEE